MRSVSVRQAIVPLMAIAMAVVLVAGCKRSADDTGSAESVSIGIQVSPAMLLPMVAKDMGYFEAEGLDVELKEFTAGKFALQAFLGGSIDMAISGEVPAGLAILQGNQFSVVAQVVEDTKDEVRVVAIGVAPGQSAQDYFSASKRVVATSFGGGPEFFTYEFFKTIGIDMDQVQLISQRPEDMPASLQARSVDAIAVFDPFAFIAEQRLGAQAVTFRRDDIYSELYVLNVRSGLIESDPATVEAVLRALMAASRSVQTDPENAKEIMQRYTKLDRSVIDGIWDNFVFRLALTPELVSLWERQAAWAKATGKAESSTPMPDYEVWVHAEPLKSVDSESVTLGR